MKLPTRLSILSGVLALACAAGAAQAADQRIPAGVSPAGIPAFSDEMLSPDFWIGRLLEPNAVLLDARQAAAKRSMAYAPQGGFVDLQAIPATLDRAQVAAWLAQAEQTPVKIGVDDGGKPVTPATLSRHPPQHGSGTHRRCKPGALRPERAPRPPAFAADGAHLLRRRRPARLREPAGRHPVPRRACRHRARERSMANGCW
jgi:hypothetical protein